MKESKSTEKIDEHLDPLEDAVCGSVTRSDEVALDKYKDIGKSQTLVKHEAFVTDNS